MRTARSYVQISAGVLFALLLLIFIYHQTRGLFVGTSIIITSPQNGSLVQNPVLTITGTAKKVAFISLNGRQIFTNEDGTFEESLLLAPGYTIITLSAEDAFKRKIEKKLEVVYVPNASTTNKTSTKTTIERTASTTATSTTGH